MTRLPSAGAWLAAGHHYLPDAAAMVVIEGKARRPHASDKLAEYLAASAPLHCADGWGYLGSSLLALAQGDPDLARHLGYYAELRAAMSLLATAGVGIFNTFHAVIEDSGAVRTVTGAGTHKFAWEALEAWADTTSARQILSRAVAPAGTPLEDWVKSLRTGGSWDAIGSRLLRVWGVDLRRLALDHVARNQASYRPTMLISRNQLPASDARQFLVSLWRVFEPVGPDVFAKLDRHLLRRTLEDAYIAIKPKGSGKAEVVSATVETMLGSGPMQDSLARFLRREEEPDDSPLLGLAQCTDTPEKAGHHLQVVSRAALLLRAATGSCVDLYRTAGRPLDAMSFWWDELGAARGLWEPGKAPDPLTDLWEDVELALLYLDPLAIPASYFSLAAMVTNSFAILGSCERIAVWGLTA